MIEKKKRVLKIVVIVFFVLLVVIAADLMLPRGRIIEGEVRPVSKDSVEFLYDLTYESEDGSVVYEHQIFDRVFEMIDGAEEFVVVDMFLFEKSDGEVYRNLAQELTDHLLQKKSVNPKVKLFFITDYYNVIYYGDEYLRQLDEAGIEVIFSSSDGKRFLGEKDFINSLFKKFKSKLNHRKTVIADSGDKIVSLITSGNPHDASSPNSNVGFYFEEEIWRDIYGLEKGEGLIEDSELDLFLRDVEEEKEGEVSVQYLADGGLMHSLVEGIDKTVSGNSVEILIFYLSDSDVINSLLKASERGVDVKLILDVNVQSFGEEKFGVPNKPVAEKLVKKSGDKIDIRWYLSHGEQFHTKMAIIENGTDVVVFLGSSNFATNERIIYNLQADVKVVVSLNSSLAGDVNDYFDRLWLNRKGVYTVDYEKFRDTSFLKSLRYEFGQWFIRFV